MSRFLLLLLLLPRLSRYLPRLVALCITIAGASIAVTSARETVAGECDDGESHAEVTVVRPRPMPGPLDNPLKGWCPYTNAGQIHLPYSMAFRYVSWKELEPVEGDFRFEAWEDSWDDELGTDKHVIFRVYVDYPSKPSGLPDWLRDAGVRETRYTDHGGGKSPDYNDPRMIAGMERLIAALGKRYNRHARVGFVQLGLLGFWGEWHTYPRSELYATPETERRVIDAFRKAFPDKGLMVRYARGYAGQQDWIGFHDDMFPEDTDNGKDWSFLAGLRVAGRTDNWRGAVVGGEMVPGKAETWMGREHDKTLTMLERAHFTWVGPYCPALAKPRDHEFSRRSNDMVRRMGYDFRIDEITHSRQSKDGQPIQISLRGTNLGVAPFYYPWPVELALFDASGMLVTRRATTWDIRRWQPGTFAETARLALEAPPGTYRLGIGIRDPWKDRPSIRFANDLTVSEGWTWVSEVHVTSEQ